MRRWLKKWGLLVFGVVLALAGLVLMLLRYSEFTKSLGEAGFIAGILISPVDYFVKTHLVEAAARDISRYMWGQGTPREIIDRVWDTLSANRIVRRNASLRYTICLLPERPDRLKLTLELEWELENLTNSPETYLQYMDFHWFERATLKKVWFMDLASPENNYEIETPQMQTDETKEWFEGPEKKLKPHQKYKSGATYTKECPVEGNDHLFFASAAIGMTVIAEWPEDYDFYPPITPIHTANRWEYPGKGFIKGDYIEVKWRKKPDV
jgi:hypothetical protein